VPPLVLDHGGPPELVPPGTGHVLPLQSRAQIIWDLQGLFRSYTNDPEALGRLGAAAQDHIGKYFTWEAKAEQILEIYRWVLGERDEKPDWGVPLGTVDCGIALGFPIDPSPGKTMISSSPNHARRVAILSRP
jgi:hypothetical protein